MCAIALRQLPRCVTNTAARNLAKFVVNSFNESNPLHIDLRDQDLDVQAEAPAAGALKSRLVE